MIQLVARVHPFPQLALLVRLAWRCRNRLPRKTCHSLLAFRDDHGPSKDFITPRLLMESDISAFENVILANDFPARGAFIIALPMKIGAGSGGPLRIVAALPPAI